MNTNVLTPKLDFETIVDVPSARLQPTAFVNVIKITLYLWIIEFTLRGKERQ